MQNVISYSGFVVYFRSTHLSLKVQTSSIRPVRSPRVAWVTHFSTTFEANLCCDSTRTLPRTLFIRMDLSSCLPCSENTKVQG